MSRRLRFQSRLALATLAGMAGVAACYGSSGGPADGGGPDGGLDSSTAEGGGDAHPTAMEGGAREPDADARATDAATDAGADAAADALTDGAPSDAAGPSTDDASFVDGDLLFGDSGGCPVAPFTAPPPPDDASTSLSSATIAPATSRSGSDFFDWSQLPGGSLSAATAPVCVTSNGGLAATITNPTGAVFSDGQGNPWAGNFAPGDALLCSGQVTPTGPITITFATPVSGVGAQMGADLISGTGVPFVEQMVVYGTSGQALGTFVTTGMMDTAADNSAVYLGATDTVAEIKAVTFFISGAENNSNNAYCMNKLSIQP